MILRVLQRFSRIRGARLIQRHRHALGTATIGACLTRAWIGKTTSLCEEASSEEVPKLSPESLSHDFLLKQASISAVDSTSRVLTHLTAAILDAHEQYRQSLNKMCALMKIYETELGLCSGEDPMWLELIAIREETNRCKAALLALESRMQSICNLLEAVAQAAFVNGAEYAGICANERLLSAERQLKQATEHTSALESLVVELHKEAILSSANEETKEEKEKEGPKQHRVQKDAPK